MSPKLKVVGALSLIILFTVFFVLLLHPQSPAAANIDAASTDLRPFGIEFDAVINSINDNVTTVIPVVTFLKPITSNLFYD